MPEASTGGAGGRGNTRSPGTAPLDAITFVAAGYVRIDMQDDGTVTFTDAASTFADRAVEVTAERGFYTYVGSSGRSWTVPSTWRSGDTIPTTDVTWAATRIERIEARRERDRLDVTTFSDTRPQYIAGGGGGGGGGYATFTGSASAVTMSPCPCAACQDRTAIRSASVAGSIYMQPSETDKQRRERHLEEARAREQRLQEALDRKARQDEAAARAEETLRMVLRPDELASYDLTNEIIITGGDGNQYLIGSGIVGNVFLLGSTRDDRQASLCCHPDMYAHGGSESLPYRDAHIAQILYLRHAIEKFWKTANVEWYNSQARQRIARDIARNIFGGGQP